MQLQFILGLVAIAAPLVTWQLTAMKAKWIDTPAAIKTAVTVAVDKEHAAGIKAADDRMAAFKANLEQQSAADAEAARKAAAEAEASIGPTPVDKAGLRDICNKSASCRDQAKGGE